VNKRTCKVDIEVEDYAEYTSEEDPDEDKQGSDKEGSNYGSNKNSKKKKKDAMVNFERKMTTRLKVDMLNKS
jgi:hypothetical protein